MTRKPTNEDKALAYVLSHLITYRGKGGDLIARCNRCNSIVLKSDLHKYSGQCMECDEDLHTFEWHYDGINTIDKKEFEELLENTQAEMFRYLG